MVTEKESLFLSEIRQKISVYWETIAYSVVASIIIINVSNGAQDESSKSNVSIANILIGDAMGSLVISLFLILFMIGLVYLYVHMDRQHVLHRTLLCLCVITDLCVRVFLALTSSSVTTYLDLIKPQVGVSKAMPVVIICFYVVFAVYFGNIKGLSYETNSPPNK